MEPLPIRVVRGGGDPVAVERLLRALPDWFGIEESVVQYVADAARLPTYLAHRTDGDPAALGALLLTRHFPLAAEVHLMAVDPTVHRRGVGHALLSAALDDLRADGVQLLQVKTLGPSRRDDGYERTRRFYLAEGFVPLEEIHDLWPGNPCLVLVKVL